MSIPGQKRSYLFSITDLDDAATAATILEEIRYAIYLLLDKDQDDA